MVLTHSLGKHKSADGPDFVRVRSSYGHLDISFRRTVRVADNRGTSYLPPDLGPHTLYSTANYSEKLAKDAASSEYFLGMNHIEALAIRLQANAPFMVRIFVDDINAVSGLLSTPEPRDYLEVHKEKHEWLDGVAYKSATTNVAAESDDAEWHHRHSVAHQLVAVEHDYSASYASQLRPVASHCGIRIESTPLRLPEYPTAPFEVNCKTLTGKTYTATVHSNMTMLEVMQVLGSPMGTPPEVLRVIRDGKQISFGPSCMSLNKCMGSQAIDYFPTKLQLSNISQGSGWATTPFHLFATSFDGPKQTSTDSHLQGCILHLVQRLRGGGKERKTMASTGWHRRYRAMRIAPGGMIYQHFSHDINSSLWDETSTMTFTTTMLERDHFFRVTGSRLPHAALDEAAYSSLGLPYFQDHRHLKRQIRNNPALQGTYTALKDGVPIKSLGEMRDILEESQQIKAEPMTGEAPESSNRRVQLTEIDELKVQLHATSFVPESQRGIVKWSTRGESVDEEPKSLSGFPYDTSGTDDTDEDPECRDKLPVRGGPTPKDSNDSGAATLASEKRRTLRSRVRGLLKRDRDISSA